MKKIFWTEHAKIKMRQYGLSAGKILQVLRKPERKEKGVAPGCTALMQTRKIFTSAKALAARKTQAPPPGEIWLMYKDTPSTGSGQAMRKIISAWRYPGISKPGESVPIPEDIKQELLDDGNSS